MTREEVIRQYREALPTGAVLGFFEAHRPLSNFHLEPFKMHGLTWPCSENVYQFSKIKAPTDKDIQFFGQCSPGQAKKAGKTVARCENWEDIKLGVMQMILEYKFKQCPVALKCLLGITGEIVEVNWWGDTYWGVCDGKGQNHLGKTLTWLRDNIKQKGITWPI